jgi:hypothetical protein
MDISQRERVIDLQNMSEEQLQMLIQNLNKELENAKQEFQNRLKRILMPFGIYYSVLLAIGTKEEVEEFSKEIRENAIQLGPALPKIESQQVKKPAAKASSKKKSARKVNKNLDQARGKPRPSGGGEG